MTQCLKIVGLMVLALPSVAQVSLTDNLKLSGATGNLGAGYTGNYGNVVSSSHSLDWNGAGSITGFYYDPNFLSFNVQPYYDQSRANSDSRSVADSSGLNLSSSIFSGSRFPGSIGYSKSFNSQGTFGVPGLPDFTTHGNNDAFTVGWSANLENLPSLTAQYQLTHSAYNIYGMNADGTAASHSITLRSYYNWDDFILNGGYSHAVSNSDTPFILSAGEGSVTSDVGTDSWTFNASHRLPLRGDFSASFSRYSSDYNYFNESKSGGSSASNDYSTTASIQPSDRVSVSGSLSFDDNLGSTVTQEILGAGGTTQQIMPINGSHSLSMTGAIGYQAIDGLSLSAQVQRRLQTWMGANFGVTSYGGLARYNHQLFGGGFGAAMSVTGSHEDNTPGIVVGFSDIASYSRRVAGWNINVGAGYSQNVQTLLVTYMTSNYNVGGTLQKRFGPVYWSAGASSARTGMTRQQGEGAQNNSYSTGISTGKWFAASASYQNSSGTAIQTIAGLTPIPINPIINPEALILYGGHSYSFSASTSPVRRFSFAATYSRSMSNTTSSTLFSSLDSKQLTVTTRYQWRQMYFMGGYSQFVQGVTSAGVPASRLNSFYFGVNRWFNWF